MLRFIRRYSDSAFIKILFGLLAATFVLFGAGMYGIAAAGALLLKGVRNILAVDRAPVGLEGPWVTYARMETLRSPKHLPGIPLGIPSLTFRAWHEARFGAAAWETLYKIPNADWQDYILWVRRMLGVPVRNGVTVLRLTPGTGMVAARLATPEGAFRSPSSRSSRHASSASAHASHPARCARTRRTVSSSSASGASANSARSCAWT